MPPANPTLLALASAQFDEWSSGVDSFTDGIEQNDVYIKALQILEEYSRSIIILSVIALVGLCILLYPEEPRAPQRYMKLKEEMAWRADDYVAESGSAGTPPAGKKPGKITAQQMAYVEASISQQQVPLPKPMLKKSSSKVASMAKQWEAPAEETQEAPNAAPRQASRQRFKAMSKAAPAPASDKLPADPAADASCASFATAAAEAAAVRASFLAMGADAEKLMTVAEEPSEIEQGRVERSDPPKPSFVPQLVIPNPNAHPLDAAKEAAAKRAQFLRMEVEQLKATMQPVDEMLDDPMLGA